MEDVYPSNETTAWGLILLAQTSNSDHRSLDEKIFLSFCPTLEHLELAILSEGDDFRGGESLCVKQEHNEN